MILMEISDTYTTKSRKELKKVKIIWKICLN